MDQRGTWMGLLSRTMGPPFGAKGVVAAVSLGPRADLSRRRLDLDAAVPGKILCEGLKAESVSRRARATGKPFAMLYVPKKNESHALERAIR